MSTVRARVEYLLKEAKEYDPDKRYMAANDLCSELLKDQESIEGSLVKQICSVFLAQLDDISIDVQGNAVRCIKRIVSKIHETQVSEVISKLGDCLRTGKDEFRDIYATCLKGLIADVPDSQAAVVCDTMMPILLQCVESKNPNVAEEALEILTDLIKKFPGQLHTNTDRSALIGELNKLLLSTKSSVRKKTVNCIGAVSLILPVGQLQGMVGGIMRQVGGKGQKKDIYAFVQALGAVARNVGEKLAGSLRSLFEILFEHCETNGLDLESQTIETDYELIESCLNAIECLVRRCAKEVLDHIPRVMGLALRLASYDPNYSYAEAEEEADEDWGSEDDSDYGNPADDSSWKIRRAALAVLDAVIKSRPEILSGYYTDIVQMLLKGFKEREENVKLDVFRTFSTLIKSVLIGDIESLQSEELPTLLRTRSSAEVFQDLLPMIIEGVAKELQAKSARTREAVTSFLADLSLSFPQSLAENLSAIKPGIIRNLDDVANSALRISTLTICKRLFRGHSNSNVELCFGILPQIQTAVRDSYYKITAEALKLISSIVKALPNETRFVAAVFPLVLDRLALTDIDQEVKQSAIYSMATILSAGTRQLNHAEVRRALELITERLKNEVTRVACLKAWIKISQSPQLPAVDETLLRALCEELQSLVKKSLRTLKLSTLEAMVALARVFVLPSPSAQTLLSELPPLISENDLHLAQHALLVVEALISKHVSPTEEILASIVNAMNTLAVSALVQGATLSNLCLAYKAVVKNLRYQPDKLVNAIAGRLGTGRKALEISAQCSAAVATVADPSYMQSFLKRLMDGLKAKNDASGFAALCIGEIGMTSDLSAVPHIAESLIELFDNKSEDTKVCASIALGKLAVGNLERFLPVIFAEFAVETHRYLLLNSIDEVITYKAERMAPHIGQILPVLFENADRPEENVRNLSAECLGKLVSVAPEVLSTNIIGLINSGSVYCKITMVSAVKFVVHNKTHQYTDYMEQLLPIILNCLNIPDVHLKKACLVSLNSIAHNASSALKQHFSAICDKVFSETLIKQELVKKVDLGAFTHITDEGLPIRKAAFSVIETLIEQLPERIDANKVLEHIVIGLDDTSDEVQTLCHQLVTKLIQWAAGAVAGNLNVIISNIRKNVEKNFRLITQKQEVERATDVLRSALRCVDKIEAQVETEASVPFKEFLAYVNGVGELENMMHSIRSQRESLFFS